MSEYIHEIVLQDFVVENIQELNLVITDKKKKMQPIVNAVFNKKKGFWDLTGTLSNGATIPIEVEWMSSNFYDHKHPEHDTYPQFKKKNGTVVVLRRNRKLPGIQQFQLIGTQTQDKFIRLFKKWYAGKYNSYIDATFNPFLVGNYGRTEPRIILYSLSKKAAKNYFPAGQLYRKNNTGPFILGFRQNGYDINAFVQDIQEGDICLFTGIDGTRCTRPKFKRGIQDGKNHIRQLTAYRITSKLIDRREKTEFTAPYYWKGEITASQLIYPYVCTVEEIPFYDVRSGVFPHIASFSEDTWEDFRSCAQYGEYRELSAHDYVLLTSSIAP